MCLPSAPDTSAADKAAADARAEEEARQGSIRLGTNSVNDIFNQYNEDFFQRNLAQPFIDYSTPQFNEQRRNSFEDLVFALSGRGLLNSSVGARARNEFNSFADRQLSALQDQGRAKVDEGLGRVESERGNILANLNATADSQAAIRAAQTQAGLLGAQPAFSPLGAMFANFSSSFLNNRQAAAAAGGGGGGATSLFSSSGSSNGGSSRVIGG